MMGSLVDEDFSYLKRERAHLIAWWYRISIPNVKKYDILDFLKPPSAQTT